MTVSASSCLPGIEFLCDGQCKSKSIVCNGIQDCWDNADEAHCHAASQFKDHSGNLDVAKSIVVPTILACIVMVGIMLFGIKKCKEWELDRIADMRRTRRIVQRLTARLREKNCRTLQRARDIRKRALLAQRNGLNHGATGANVLGEPGTSGAVAPGAAAPPSYDSGPPFLSGNSPPPTYEDALFDEYYDELFARSDERHSASISSGSSMSSRRGQTNRRRSSRHAR